MISRFHCMLQLGCRATDGQVGLAAWFQGPALHEALTVPRLAYNVQADRWYEPGESEGLPHRPDALFILRFPELPKDEPRRAVAITISSQFCFFLLCFLCNP